MEVKWQVENDDYCTRVLARHWPGVKRWGDVRGLLAYANRSGRKRIARQRARRRQAEAEPWPDFPDGWAADLICGGFPCQPVSVAGKRAGDSDARWLWPQMRRVCSVLRPRWVLAENVPGLLSADAGRLFGEVVRDLAALGYRVEWDCVSAASVGAPHIRDRVFIVAYARGERDERRSSDCGRSDRSGAFGEPKRSGEILADDDSERQPDLQGQRAAAVAYRTTFAGSDCCGFATSQWCVEPDVGRVAHGVPARVDRLRSLGNAVVPQVAEFIGRMILESDQ